MIYEVPDELMLVCCSKNEKFKSFYRVKNRIRCKIFNRSPLMGGLEFYD